MPNFQQSVNQTIGIAGVLGGLSGATQKAAEKRSIKKQQDILDQQRQNLEKSLQEDYQPDDKGNVVLDPQKVSQIQQSRKELSRINQRQEDISSRLYDIEPTMERYRQWQENASINQNWKDEYANIAKQEQAMARQDRQKQAKQTQRRNFMDYLAKQPTSLGGTVGDLSPNLQKQIASQYSKNERRNMMNRMDREAADGKQK